MTDSTKPTRSRHPRPFVEGGGLIGFVFGLILGFVLGFASMLFNEVGYQLWFASACAVVVGLIGFFYGDRFWFWLIDHVDWLR